MTRCPQKPGGIFLKLDIKFLKLVIKIFSSPVKWRVEFLKLRVKIFSCYNKSNLGVAQLVARSVRDAEVVSSSLITQTIFVRNAFKHDKIEK